MADVASGGGATDPRSAPEGFEEDTQDGRKEVRGLFGCLSAGPCVGCEEGCIHRVSDGRIHAPREMSRVRVRAACVRARVYVRVHVHVFSFLASTAR